MLFAQPENQRGQSDENSRHAKRPAIARFLTDDRDYEESARGADIDGPVEPTINLSQGEVLIGSKLIANKCRHTRLDSTSPNRQQCQTGQQSSAIAFEQRQRSVAKAV